jgi:hypothetical protein
MAQIAFASYKKDPQTLFRCLPLPSASSHRPRRPLSQSLSISLSPAHGATKIRLSSPAPTGSPPSSSPPSSQPKSAHRMSSRRPSSHASGRCATSAIAMEERVAGVPEDEESGLLPRPSAGGGRRPSSCAPCFPPPPPSWVTVDGPLVLPLEEAEGHTRRFFLWGFACLPFL